MYYAEARCQGNFCELELNSKFFILDSDWRNYWHLLCQKANQHIFGKLAFNNSYVHFSMGVYEGVSTGQIPANATFLLISVSLLEDI